MSRRVLLSTAVALALAAPVLAGGCSDDDSGGDSVTAQRVALAYNDINELCLLAAQRGSDLHSRALVTAADSIKDMSAALQENPDLEVQLTPAKQQTVRELSEQTVRRLKKCGPEGRSLAVGLESGLSQSG